MSATASKTQAPHSPFWQFSIKLYAVPGVAPACNRLQDEAGVDVNLLFFLLWNAAQGRSLGEADVRELDRTIAPWRSMTVIPLREMRRALKSSPAILAPETAEAFRNRIKATELEAERLLQEALYALGQSGRFGRSGLAPLDAARASMSAYQALLFPFPPEPMEQVLAAFAQHVPSR
jgi:uncharacterized protein (TIGR02444 family)